MTEAERYLEAHRDGFAKWLMSQPKEFQAKIAQGWTEQRKHEMRERMKRIKRDEKAGYKIASGCTGADQENDQSGR